MEVREIDIFFIKIQMIKSCVRKHKKEGNKMILKEKYMKNAKLEEKI